MFELVSSPMLYDAGGQLPRLYIDGEKTEFTGYYHVSECIGGIQFGCVMGMNEASEGHGMMNLRKFEVTGTLWIINVVNHRADGTTWGLKGVFRNGSWGADEDDCPAIYVSDRII